MQDGKSPSMIVNVVMRAACFVEALEPSLFEADYIRHAMQFLGRIGEHVAHEGAAKGLTGCINVDSHTYLFENGKCCILEHGRLAACARIGSVASR